MINIQYYDSFHDYPDVININQLMKMLHIGKTSAYKLISSGSIHSFKIGKNYKIPKLSVIKYIADEVEN